MIKNIEELNELVESGVLTNPLQAIRAKCLDCSVYDYSEVRNCFVTKCPLYPFRMGKNPFRKKRELTQEQRERLVAQLKKSKS